MLGQSDVSTLLPRVAKRRFPEILFWLTRQSAFYPARQSAEWLERAANAPDVNRPKV